jgi:hypothetical protein
MKLITLLIVSVALLVGIAGCESMGMRWAATETQKENAYVHERTAALAANRAEQEGTSTTLQELTELSQVQSEAFVADYGLPAERPLIRTPEDALDESNWQRGRDALVDGQRKPDTFDIVDGGLTLALALSGVVGGAYGVKIKKYVTIAKQKSDALREIVAGVDTMKQDNNYEAYLRFKASQDNQSVATKKLVAEIKAEV